MEGTPGDRGQRTDGMRLRDRRLAADAPGKSFERARLLRGEEAHHLVARRGSLGRDPVGRRKHDLMVIRFVQPRQSVLAPTPDPVDYPCRRRPASRNALVRVFLGLLPERGRQKVGKVLQRLMMVAQKGARFILLFETRWYQLVPLQLNERQDVHARRSLGQRQPDTRRIPDPIARQRRQVPFLRDELQERGIVEAGVIDARLHPRRDENGRNAHSELIEFVVADDTVEISDLCHVHIGRCCRRRHDAVVEATVLIIEQDEQGRAPQLFVAP